jgi:hypothetical protein
MEVNTVIEKGPADHPARQESEGHPRRGSGRILGGPERYPDTLVEEILIRLNDAFIPQNL